MISVHPIFMKKQFLDGFPSFFFAISVVFFFKIIVWTIPDIMVTFFFGPEIRSSPNFEKCTQKSVFYRFWLKNCRFPLVILLKNLHNCDMHGWVWLFWRHRFSVYLKITKISLKNAHFSVIGPISVFNVNFHQILILMLVTVHKNLNNLICMMIFNDICSVFSQFFGCNAHPYVACRDSACIYLYSVVQ